MIARIGTITVPIRVVLSEDARDVVERAASQLDYHASQGFDGSESAAAMADELRELLDPRLTTKEPA